MGKRPPPTLDDLLRFQNRARAIAYRHRRPDLAEEFAQEVVVAFLQNCDRRSTLNQMWIDLIRKEGHELPLLDPEEDIPDTTPLALELADPGSGECQSCKRPDLAMIKGLCLRCFFIYCEAVGAARAGPCATADR